MDALKQLQELLRDLFQLDLADLDFGLYRLLRLKRQEVEAFLTEQLPRRVDEAFEGAAGEERGALEKEISELADRIRKEIAEDAILESGDVNPDYRAMKVKAARELLNNYEAKRRQLHAVQATEVQKAEVFNHLYAFFSRYYEAGDFIPRRRFGARESYAVPYNGEETLFHWANKDQHYVKTAEAFRDYAFSVEAVAGPYRVRFVLTEANLPPGNTKGDMRYFFPLPEQIHWEKDSRTLRLPFHYRLPTEREIDKLGKNSRLQEAILQGGLPKILHAVPDDTLRAALAVTVEQKEDQMICLLLKRLRHFTRRNTTDYFIHKQLDSFLKRELEFYLRDQVMHLGDLEGDLEGKRRTLRVIRQLAEELIIFLGQIENVQKRLFEKKKFVLRTDYLVPIKEVPREMWKEVLTNKAQIAEWKSLFAVESKTAKLSEQLLKEHPTLVVNTSHFGSDFTDRLLGAFEDLDEATDGILIHAENYQALRLLERKYAGKVKCIYIDPPYNTGSDEFIYKDRYRHSSWLAMMATRLQLAKAFMRGDGLIFVSTDENELGRISALMDQVFGDENRIENLIWKKSYGGGAKSKHVVNLHEYVWCYARGLSDVSPLRLKPDEKVIKRYYKFKDSKFATRGPYRLQPLATTSMDPRPNLRYSIPYKGREIWPEQQWQWSKERSRKALEADELVFIENGGDEVTVNYKQYLKDEHGEIRPSMLYSIVDDIFTQQGTAEIRAFFGNLKAYTFPKPSALIRAFCEACCPPEDVVLDFFAGSGTTGHAVINLNREDGGRRKFILVEMANYFDTVLLPRIQKVMYTPEWKDGKPRRPPTKEEIERTPRLVKVLRLEGYEDALHNLSTDGTLKREEPRAKAHKDRLGDHAYRLSYLVRLPLEASASMLNLSALELPFNYQIEVLTEDGPKVETVDLVETFNLLYGLHVERLEMWVNDKNKRGYRAVKAKNRDGHSVLVLWRDMTDLDPVVERRFLEAKLKGEGPFVEILINGDTATPGIKSLDGLFKRLLEEGEK